MYRWENVITEVMSLSSFTPHIIVKQLSISKQTNESKQMINCFILGWNRELSFYASSDYAPATLIPGTRISIRFWNVFENKVLDSEQRYPNMSF